MLEIRLGKVGAEVDMEDDERDDDEQNGLEGGA